MRSLRRFLPPLVLFLAVFLPGLGLLPMPYAAGPGDHSAAVLLLLRDAMGAYINHPPLMLFLVKLGLPPRLIALFLASLLPVGTYLAGRRFLSPRAAWWAGVLVALSGGVMLHSRSPFFGMAGLSLGLLALAFLWAGKTKTGNLLGIFAMLGDWVGLVPLLMAGRRGLLGVLGGLLAWGLHLYLNRGGYAPQELAGWLAGPRELLALPAVAALRLVVYATPGALALLPLGRASVRPAGLWLGLWTLLGVLFGRAFLHHGYWTLPLLPAIAWMGGEGMERLDARRRALALAGVIPFSLLVCLLGLRNQILTPARELMGWMARVPVALVSDDVQMWLSLGDLVREENPRGVISPDPPGEEFTWGGRTYYARGEGVPNLGRSWPLEGLWRACAKLREAAGFP